MKCKIKAFGIAREIIGLREVQIDLQAGQSIGTLKTTLFKQYPRLEQLKSLFIAVNREYAEDDLPLREDDEIALIPPVAGG